ERGEKESELTIPELIYYANHTPDYLDIEDIMAEINGRLARTVSVFFLPFLALPIGMSSRRTSKSLRMVVGVLFLIVYYEVLQFGEAMVRKGIVGPVPSLWLPCGLFAISSIWLFWIAERRPGQDPLAHLFEALSGSTAWFKRLFRRRHQRPAE